MNDDQLISMRDNILKDIVPLVLENSQNGSDRFDLLLRIIQFGGANSEIYSRAYESAKLIEEKGERLEALLSLLDEIDFEVNQDKTSNDGTVVNPNQQENTSENSSQVI